MFTFGNMHLAKPAQHSQKCWQGKHILKPTKVDVHPEISVTKRVLTYPLSDRDEALLKNTQSPSGHLLRNPHYEKTQFLSFCFCLCFMISIEKTSEGHDFSSTLVGDFLAIFLKKNVRQSGHFPKHAEWKVTRCLKFHHLVLLLMDKIKRESPMNLFISVGTKTLGRGSCIIMVQWEMLISPIVVTFQK